MPLDPQAQAVLDQLAALNLPPNYTVTPLEARANAKLRPSVPGPEVSTVEDRVIQGPGGDVPVRIYTPAGAGPFPVLVWFHGGGMVLGDLDTADGTARHLCVGAGCVVVSVDYRLAPEHKFPAAPEDCYAATEWVSKNADSMGVDANRMAVGGDSAGGNLATVVALMSRDRGGPPLVFHLVALMSRDRGGPPLVFHLVVYPMVDRDFNTESYRSNADGYLLTRDSMRWYWNHYLGTEADTDTHGGPGLQHRIVPIERGWIPADARLDEMVLDYLGTEADTAIPSHLSPRDPYEPVFGQIKQGRGFRAPPDQ